MAVIYIDNFVSALTADAGFNSVDLALPPDDVVRVVAAMSMGGSAPESVWGGRFVSVALIVGDSEELVHAQYSPSYGVIRVERTRSQSYLAGTPVRCAPPAKTIAAGHMFSRTAQEGDAIVVARPGERSVFYPSELDCYVRVAQGEGGGGVLSHEVSFFGDDWPSEVFVQNNKMARTLSLIQAASYSTVEFFVTGTEGAVTSITIPATCRYAVLKIRKVPAGARNTYVLWLVSPEYYG